MSGIASAIYKGEHDDELRQIEQACKARQRQKMSSFKRNDRVRIVGAGGRIDGCMATVIKPNQKTVSIVVDGGLGEWRVSPNLIEAA